jgi:hypothetical protein
MKQSELKFSFETLIVTYLPRVALRSLSKENGVSSAKGLDTTSRTHPLGPLDLLTLLHETSNYANM